MTNRKNRELKNEVVDLQLAAQQWEEKYIEAMRRPVCTGRCASSSAEAEELRVSLGEASRELMASQAHVRRLQERLSKHE